MQVPRGQPDYIPEEPVENWSKTMPIATDIAVAYSVLVAVAKEIMIGGKPVS